MFLLAIAEPFTLAPHQSAASTQLIFIICTRAHPSIRAYCRFVHEILNLHILYLNRTVLISNLCISLKLELKSKSKPKTQPTVFPPHTSRTSRTIFLSAVVFLCKSFQAYYFYTFMAYTHTSHAYFYGGRKKLVKTTKRLYGIVVLCFFLAPQFEFIKWFCCDATNLPLKCTCTLQFISFHQIPFSPACELDHIIRFIKHFIASTTCILSIILENGNGDLFGSALFAK